LFVARQAPGGETRRRRAGGAHRLLLPLGAQQPHTVAVGEQREARQHEQQQQRHQQPHARVAKWCWCRPPVRAPFSPARGEGGWGERGGRHHSSREYRATGAGPANSATNAPPARKTPNGSREPRSRRPAAISVSPTTAPASEPRKTVTTTPCQPRNAPTIASI